MAFAIMHLKIQMIPAISLKIPKGPDFLLTIPLAIMPLLLLLFLFLSSKCCRLSKHLFHVVSLLVWWPEPGLSNALWC